MPYDEQCLISGIQIHRTANTVVNCRVVNHRMGVNQLTVDAVDRDRFAPDWVIHHPFREHQAISQNPRVCADLRSRRDPEKRARAINRSDPQQKLSARNFAGSICTPGHIPSLR